MTKRVKPSASESVGEPEIPSSWTRLSLGEVGRWVGGGTPSRANIRFWTDGTIPWVSPKDMKTDRLSSAQETITEAAVAHSATNLVEKGSVLLVVRSGILEHTLPVAIAERQMALNQDLKAIAPVKEVDSEYLAWALRTSARTILRSCAKAGTTVASLELPELLRFQIPVAPIPEQRRIVAEIEKQFTRLEAGVAALRRVQANLKRYRAAVLKAACEGKLVPTEAEMSRHQPSTKNSQRAFETGAELLTRILAERRNNWTGRGQYKEPVAPDTANLPPLPEGWTWATADQLSSQITDGEHIQPKYTEAGFPILSAKHVRSGHVVFTDVPSISKHDFDLCLKRCAPQRDDILIVCVGATTGRAAIVGEAEPFALVRSVLLIRSLINPRFLLSFIQSPETQTWIQRASGSSAQAHLYINSTKKMLVPLPPLAEQTRIVAEVERRLSVVEELESVVSANLKRAQQLRQSILNYAFQGKLGTHSEADESVTDLADLLESERTMKAKATPRMQPAEPELLKAVETRVSLNEALKALPKEVTIEHLCRTAGYNPALATDVDDFFQEVKGALGKLFILRRSANDDILLRKVSR